MEKYVWGRSRSMIWTHVAIGLGGVLVGAAAGIMLAPKSGGELRRLLWRFVTRKDAQLEDHEVPSASDSQHDLGRASNSSAQEPASAH